MCVLHVAGRPTAHQLYHMYLDRKRTWGLVLSLREKHLGLLVKSWRVGTWTNDQGNQYAIHLIRGKWCDCSRTMGKTKPSLVRSAAVVEVLDVA